jgi:hypothetical protein
LASPVSPNSGRKSKKMLPLSSDSGSPRSYNCGSAGGSHFPDVYITDAYCRHVNYLWARDVIGGYADGTFRPGTNVTRSQMAKFIAEGLSLPLY